MRVPLKRTRLTAWPQHTGNRVTLVETLLTLGGATTCLRGKALTRCALASKQRSLLVTCCAKGAWCLHACALPQSHSSNLPQKGLPFSTPQMQELRKCRTEKQGKDRHRPQTDSHLESKHWWKDYASIIRCAASGSDSHDNENGCMLAADVMHCCTKAATADSPRDGSGAAAAAAAAATLSLTACCTFLYCFCTSGGSPYSG